jgi:hypothetical protein
LLRARQSRGVLPEADSSGKIVGEKKTVIRGGYGLIYDARTLFRAS